MGIARVCAVVGIFCLLLVSAMPARAIDPTAVAGAQQGIEVGKSLIESDGIIPTAVTALAVIGIGYLSIQAVVMALRAIILRRHDD